LAAAANACKALTGIGITGPPPHNWRFPWTKK
jgi:hypothetical protein